MLGEHPVPDHGALGAHGQAYEEEVPLGGVDGQSGQRGELSRHVQPVAADLLEALGVLGAVLLQHEHHVFREGVEVPLGQHRPDPASQGRVGDQVAEPYAVQTEVLAEAAQHDHVGPQHGLLDDARLDLGVRELQERLVDHDQVQVGHRVHELHDRVLVQKAAVGVVRVADDGHPGTPGPDELGVLGEVQGESAGLLEREHVDPLAGLHRLVGPAAEGRDRDGEGLAHQQVVDPGDELGRAVAHRHALRRELEQTAQLGRDGVGAARVVRDDVPQPAGHVVEHGRGGEVGVAGNAEVDRTGPFAALPRQRRHRRAVRRGAAEQRGDVVSQGEPPYGAGLAGTTGPVVIGWPARGSTGRPYIRRLG